MNNKGINNKGINNILIKQGQVYDPANGLNCEISDILIEGGRIKEIGRELGLSMDGTILDCRDKVILPGLMDMHVHLREPGYEYKEDIRSGTRAAIAGGFTAVACMPNTEPVNDNMGVKIHIDEIIKRNAYCNVFQIGAITKDLKGLTLSQYFNNYYLNKGVCDVPAVSDDGNPVMDKKLMLEAAEICQHYEIPIISHCENILLSNGGQINQGQVSTHLNIKGIPRESEINMIRREIGISKYTGCHIHIAHVSTEEGVNLIRDAKDHGYNVTAEVTPHHLCFTEISLLSGNTSYKMNPPLRTEADSQALINGVIDSTIDVIASDHAPHSIADKSNGLENSAFGCIGLETSLPAMVELFYHKQGQSMSLLVDKMAIAPRKILKIRYPGLKIGEIADIIVVDLNRYYYIDSNMFNSRAVNCPFNRMFKRGWPEYTIYSGCLVYDKNVDMLIKI